MELKELLDLQEKAEGRINAYWTYWSVAVFAMTGWVFNGNTKLTQAQALGIAVGAAAFFLANLGVLWSATRLIDALLDEVRLKSAQAPPASPRLAAAYAAGGVRWRLQATVVFHLIVDVVVIAVVLSRPLPPPPAAGKTTIPKAAGISARRQPGAMPGTFGMSVEGATIAALIPAVERTTS